jgi:hypothetical protein
MATTTTNFGWDIPQSTDLVKDGATAIAALGQDIDTAFVDFKGGTTGQVLKKTSGTDLDVEWGTAGSSGLTLINTTSFSAVSSQSINDVFSATYTNYKVIGFFKSTTTAGNATLRFRVGGADNSTTNYAYQEFRAENTSITGGRGTSQNAWSFSGYRTNANSSFEILITNPFASEETSMTMDGFDNLNSASYNVYTGKFGATTSFTGFTILGTNLTGTISVYGLAK